MSVSFVIMAAGLGSRYGGIKQMEGVGPKGEILLEYAIHDALRVGYDRIVVILRPDILEDFRERVGKKLEGRIPIYYAIQDYTSIPDFYSIPADRVKPFGTIHAVLCARDYIDGPFAVLNADDYYGWDAFTGLRSTLETLRGASEACMVAYKLKNTVSPFGSVTRGICATENGLLTHIDETHDILLAEDGRIMVGDREIPGETPVSMNLWGFTREALDDMEVYFRDFLGSLKADDIKGECLLPVYVGDRLSAGKMSVRVLTTDGSWFGMTYKEDREMTARSLRELIEQGVYPEELSFKCSVKFLTPNS